jgi:hypothetical protein
MSAEPKPNPAIDVAGETDVSFYNDGLYANIRQKYKVPNDVIATANFSFGNMAAGGGKGGDPMARTTCGQFFVKEVKDCDHDSLIEHVEHYTKHLCDGDTFLCRIFAHFRRGKDGHNYMIMNSWLPVLTDEHPLVSAPAPGQKPDTGAAFWRVMDLKGCCDDKVMHKDGKKVPEVHKRFWNLGMNFSCLRSDGRNKYYAGKREAIKFDFHFSPLDHSNIAKKIAADCALFDKLQLMDYSLIVAIIEVDDAEYDDERRDQFFPQLDHFDAEQPYIAKHNGKVYGYYMGIIDFLQPWNTAKVIAHCIKDTVAPHPISTIAPTAYAKQFSSHFAARMQPDGLDIEAGHHLRSAVAIAGAAAGASPTRVAAAPEGSQRKRVKDVVFVTEV